jgi:hypothetical protein
VQNESAAGSLLNLRPDETQGESGKSIAAATA